MRRAAIVVIVLSVSALSAAAQPPPVTPSGTRLTLRGVVVDAGNGAALPRARVNVTAVRANAGSTLTDGEGRFSVDVAAGTTLTIRIVKAGYASMTLPVSAEQIRGPDPVRIEVPRGGVIAGRAVDLLGQPAHIIA